MHNLTLFFTEEKPCFHKTRIGTLLLGLPAYKEDQKKKEAVQSNGNATSIAAKGRSLPNSKHSTKTIRTQTKQARTKARYLITPHLPPKPHRLDSLQQKSTRDLFVSHQWKVV
jgi:hypothetical protein